MRERSAVELEFHGREAELEALESCWAKVSDPSAPSLHLVTILGEEGLGKTRLVMEFFRRRAADAQASGSAYWPEASTLLGQNIDVNADIAACNVQTREIPFLWWGIRALDAGLENSVRNDALPRAADDLAPHLAALNARSAVHRTGKDLVQLWAEFARDEIFSATGFGTAMSFTGKLRQSFAMIRGGIDEQKNGINVAASREASRTATAEAVLDELEAVFNPKLKTYARRPGIIFLDDAQHMKFDAGLPSFVAALVHRAATQSWPLLIVATHWRRAWTADRYWDGAYAEVIGAALEDPGDEVHGVPTGSLSAAAHTVIDLRPVADLGAALRAQLPGLTDEQSAMLLERAGGNPRFLQQIISYLLECPKYFRDFDPAGPLVDRKIPELLSETQGIQRAVQSRLNAMPEGVQEALCLAATIGFRFPRSVVEQLIQQHLGREPVDELDTGAVPYSMLRFDRSRLESGFAERLFYEEALKRRESLRSLADEDRLRENLVHVLKANIGAKAQFDRDRMDLVRRADLGDSEMTPKKRAEARENIYQLSDTFFRLCCDVFEHTEDETPYLLRALCDSRFETTEKARRIADALDAVPDAKPIGRDRVAMAQPLVEGGQSHHARQILTDATRAFEDSKVIGHDQLPDRLAEFERLAVAAFDLGHIDEAMDACWKAIGYSELRAHTKFDEGQQHRFLLKRLSELATAHGCFPEAVLMINMLIEDLEEHGVSISKYGSLMISIAYWIGPPLRVYILAGRREMARRLVEWYIQRNRSHYKEHPHPIPGAYEVIRGLGMLHHAIADLDDAEISGMINTEIQFARQRELERKAALSHRPTGNP